MSYLNEQKNKFIQIVGIDLDGTLLNDQKKICKRNIEILQKAKEAGIKIVLCSGRPAEGMQRELSTLNLKEEGQYGIALNGGIIYQTKDSTPIFQYPMDPKAAEELILLGRSMPEQLHIQLYTKSNVMVETRCQETEYYEQSTGSRLVQVDDLMPYTKEAVKMVFFLHTGKWPQPDGALDGILSLKSTVLPQITQRVQCVISAPYLLEFFDPDVDKGKKKKKLAGYLGVPQEAVMCIGDLENDLPMLQYAGMSVAMKNGSDEVKQIAHYITSADNNQGGVAEAVEKFALETR